MASAEVQSHLNGSLQHRENSASSRSRENASATSKSPKRECPSKSPRRKLRETSQKSPASVQKTDPTIKKTGLKGGQSSLDVFDLDDVGGLPLEIWRVVLSYLPVDTLCKCSKVSKSLRYLVISLDQTTWKAHYMRSFEWREPAWPTFQHKDEKKTWQTLYKEHYLGARTWTLCNKEAHQASCLHVFRKKRERKTIRVGPKYEHSSLKSALSVASEYDRIVLAPGLYDEQFEMSSKIPFELVGEGDLGSVILLTCIEQNALTARLCNLVLRAPWFTAHVLKVISGHIQVDNCIVEDGQVSIISPGTAHLRYCKFVRTQITCSHVSLSLIENSEFSECETCAIVVEGAPWGQVNWAHKYLLHYADTYKIRQEPLHRTQSCHEECSIADFDLGSNLTLNETENEKQSEKRSHIAQASDKGAGEAVSHIASEPYSDPGEWDTESSSSEATQSVVQASYAGGQAPGPPWLSESVTTPPVWDKEAHPKLAPMIAEDSTLKELLSVVLGCMVRQCRISNGQGGITVANQGAVRIEQSDLCDLQYGIRCLQNAKVIAVENSIHRCATSGIFMRLGATGILAGNDIHSTGEAGIDVRKNADPLIQLNRIHHSKRSGIVILGCGRGTIKANDIYQNREAGIYILYKGDPYITENRICHGEAAGIAVTESGRGYIGSNLISGNRWGGIDVRRGANPRVTRNLICNGLADGIVVGTKGYGTIDANVVRGNLGCGVWVMSGRPTIQSNQIYNNKDSGVVLVHKDSDGNPSAGGSDSDSDIGGDSLFQPSLAGNSYSTSYTTGTSNNDAASNHAVCLTNLKFNSIYHNWGHGLVANSGECVLVHGNGFHGNRSVGVLVRQTACVNMTSNSVTCNAGTGIQVDSLAKIELEGNGIYDNIGSGIVISGDVKLVKNDIFYNQMTALSVEAGANVLISENRLYSAYDPAIVLDKAADGSVTENTLYEGRAKPSIQHPPHTTFRISDNDVISADGNDPGVRHDGNWFLDNPPPRPHTEAPPAISIPSTPARQVMSVTRVMTPAGGSCQQGSKLCTIL